jgi:hypothetical protein
MSSCGNTGMMKREDMENGDLPKWTYFENDQNHPIVADISETKTRF